MRGLVYGSLVTCLFLNGLVLAAPPGDRTPGPVRQALHTTGDRVTVQPEPGALVVSASSALSARPFYLGKANRFWTKRTWSEPLQAHLYWEAKTRTWYRYHDLFDAYLPQDLSGPLAEAVDGQGPVRQAGYR